MSAPLEKGTGKELRAREEVWLDPQNWVVSCRATCRGLMWSSEAGSCCQGELLCDLGCCVIKEP